jgi:hypothetical protein
MDRTICLDRVVLIKFKMGRGFEGGMLHLQWMSQRLAIAVEHLGKAWYFSHGSSDLASRLGILRFDDLSRHLRPTIPEELNR